jgi:hypothetical protein
VPYFGGICGSVTSAYDTLLDMADLQAGETGEFRPFTTLAALQYIVPTCRWNNEKSLRVRLSVAVIYLLSLSLEKENILGNLGTLAQPQQVIHNSNSIRKHYIGYVTNVLFKKKKLNKVLFQYISLVLRGITRVTVFKTMVS